MKKSSEEYLEYRDIVPETILDFKGLRKSIIEFKADEAVRVLMGYFQEEWIPKTLKPNLHKYSRFRPTISNNTTSTDDPAVETGTHDIGVFSTALCLETIAAYSKNVAESKKMIDNKTLLYLTGPNRRKNEIKGTIISTGERRINFDNKQYGYEKAHSYFQFIINGLGGGFGPDLGFLARIATLFRFGNYLNHLGIKKDFVCGIDDETRKIFNRICIECIFKFHLRFMTKKEGIHPFELYRFLQFVRQWGPELDSIFNGSNELAEYLEESNREDLNQFVNCLDAQRKTVNSDIQDNGDIVFYHFFDQVYLFAKYELYRQMSLNQSGDSRLYDAKRLIYAMLVVYLDNRFSNTLIRKRALDLIFKPFKEDRNAIWPTGQQVAMSKDGLMIISDNECVCDLLGCEYLSESLLDYISELKCMYDGYARTKRLEKGKIIGWYPIHQRDQKPTSWCTALTLSFIKRFCKLVSLMLANMAKEKFRSNYKKAGVEWKDIYDCTAVKAKIRLIFPWGNCVQRDFKAEDNDIIQHCKYRTAILFGPPGTGKTTYGRAVANKLKLDYLELTPGDFFSGGEDRILVTINDIFEHLLHLKNTVVFIDEIDDLVKDRNSGAQVEGKTTEQPYDPRTLFVNSLLPRFQELHDKKNIILLMATNNIERVDSAISRMGRVDLVIPVGAISPHGRLKFLQNLKEKNQDIFGKIASLPEKEQLELGIEYLNATEAFSYGTLKHYTKMIIDEVRNIQNEELSSIIKKIRALLASQSGKKMGENQLLIWEHNVVKPGRSYNTRPQHEKGDFQDFGHFTLKKFEQTKRLFQEEFIKLFRNLNTRSVTELIAQETEQTLAKYSNEFQMQEKTQTGKIIVEEPCMEIFYNILTPFYDDLEDAIDALSKSKEDSDRRTCEILICALSHITKMILGRSFLPE